MYYKLSLLPLLNSPRWTPDSGGRSCRMSSLIHTLQVHTFHCSRKEGNWIGQFLQYSKAKVVDGVVLQYNSCYCKQKHGWMDGLSIAQI